MEKVKKNVCKDCGHAASHRGDLKKHIEGVYKNLSITVEIVAMLPQRRRVYMHGLNGSCSSAHQPNRKIRIKLQ